MSEKRKPKFRPQFVAAIPCKRCVEDGLSTCCCACPPTHPAGRLLREEPDVAEEIQRYTKHQRLREGFGAWSSR